MATLIDPAVVEPVGRPAIEARIAELKARYDRMPAHWEARRLGVMREIDRLVDRWLASDG